MARNLRILELELELSHEKKLVEFYQAQNKLLQEANDRLLKALTERPARVEPEPDGPNPFESLTPDPEFKKDAERAQQEAQKFHETWNALYEADQTSVTREEENDAS